MNRISKLLIFALSAILINGCSVNRDNSLEGKPASSEKNNESKPAAKTEPKGITVNKIKFETLKEEDIPENLINSIKSLKANKGYIFLRKDDYYYIAILSGKKNTGGYSISVNFVEDNEGKTNIEVNEKVPSPDAIVTQAITYPYVVIKLQGITENFNIKNTKGETFLNLKGKGEDY